MEHRGDLDNDTPSSLIRRLEAIDPKSEATVIIAGGPPCHDHSRIRAEAPGVCGEEGAKFVRFSEFLKKLEKTWNYPQAILVVKCVVVPVNKQDVRLFEQKLSAQAVVSDFSDLGIIARPRVWWTRIPWQEVSHRAGCPVSLQWATYQALPRVTFVQPKDKPAGDEGGRRGAGGPGRRARGARWGGGISRL